MHKELTPNMPEQEPDMIDQWAKIAEISWKQSGSPLRPSPEDMSFCIDAIQEWSGQGAAPRVLLLGVTQEIYHLPWPEGTDFMAVDHNQAMIDMVWPGPKDLVQCRDWLDIDLPEQSRDIVLCDGGLVLLNYPEQQKALVKILHRILADNGICILRQFVPPVQPESIDSIFADLIAGKLNNMNALKIRLWLSLHKSIEAGVKLNDIWQEIERIDPGLKQTQASSGFTSQQLMMLKTFAGSPVTFHCLNPEEVQNMFCTEQGGFELHQIRVPSYELGECCPTVVLKRKR